MCSRRINRRVLAVIAALATCSVILFVTRRASLRETIASSDLEQEHRLVKQFCGSTQQNSVQWYRCLQLKYFVDESGTDGSGHGGTEKRSVLVNGSRPGEDDDIKENRSRDEEERVAGRIETCLLATNLSRYLEEEGFLSAAHDNARLMIRALRTLIPQTFSNDYLSPCWEADFRGSVRLEDETIQWEVDGIKTVTPFSALGFKEKQFMRSFSRYHHKSVLSSLVCLPKLFVAGFPKCGTTYLYCLMNQRFGGGSNMAAPMKEPMFWASGMHGNSTLNLGKVAVEHISPYLFNFLGTSMKLASSHYQSKYQQPLTIDGSTNKMAGWPRYRNEPSATNFCLLPAVIAEVLPDSKYVVLMRNPVDRLYSDFQFSCRKYNGNVTSILYQNGSDIFHERIMNRLKKFTDCIKTYPTAACLKIKSRHSDSLTCGRTQLEVSLYYIHIQKWLSVMPRDNFVFLTFEEMLTDINYVEKKLLALLGSHYPRNLMLRKDHFSACNSRTNSNSYYHDNPQLHIREDTREILTEFFRPYNQILSDLLGDDKFLWDN